MGMQMGDLTITLRDIADNQSVFTREVCDMNTKFTSEVMKLRREIIKLVRNLFFSLFRTQIWVKDELRSYIICSSWRIFFNIQTNLTQFEAIRILNPKIFCASSDHTEPKIKNHRRGGTLVQSGNRA